MIHCDMTKRKAYPHVGSHFEDFLRDESRLEEATAVAIKRVLAFEGALGKQVKVKLAA